MKLVYNRLTGNEISISGLTDSNLLKEGSNWSNSAFTLGRVGLGSTIVLSMTVAVADPDMLGIDAACPQTSLPLQMRFWPRRTSIHGGIGLGD
jgi:hypothetical protein